MLLLHAGRGARLAARRRGAHRRRGGAAGRRRRRAARACARCGSPVASRWCGAGWSTSSRRTQRGRPRRRSCRSPPTRSGWPGRPAPWPTAGLDRVNVSLDTDPARDLPRRSPAATGCDDVVAGLEAAPRRRPGPGQDQRRAAARRQRRPGGRAARLVPSSAATSCGSSSRCRSTPSTAGAATAWSPPRRSSRALERGVRADARPRSRGAARRPSCSSSTAARPRWASSRSVTRPFCGDCDRVRLTADGQVRNCLFAREESDLRTRAARRRLRRGARRALGRRHARQARRPRHRRPDVPPARPPDVRHRRLTSGRYRASSGGLGRAARRRAGTAARQGSRDERLAVVVARQPDLAPVGRVQLAGCSTAAAQVAGCRQPLAEQSVRIHRLPSRRPCQCRVPDMARCRTTTGEAVRHRGELRRGRPSSPAILARRVRKSNTVLPVSAFGFRPAAAPTSVLAVDAARSRRTSSRRVGHHHGDVRQQQCAATRTQRSQPADHDRRRRSTPCACTSRARSAAGARRCRPGGWRTRW